MKKSTRGNINFSSLAVMRGNSLILPAWFGGISGALKDSEYLPGGGVCGFVYPFPASMRSGFPTPSASRRVSVMWTTYGVGGKCPSPWYSFGEYPGQCRGVRFCFPWFPVPVVYAIRQGGIIRVTSFPGIKTPIKGALLRHRDMPLGMIYAIGVHLWAWFTPLVYAIGNNYPLGHGLTA